MIREIDSMLWQWARAMRGGAGIHALGYARETMEARLRREGGGAVHRPGAPGPIPVDEVADAMEAAIVHALDADELYLVKLRYLWRYTGRDASRRLRCSKRHYYYALGEVHRRLNWWLQRWAPQHAVDV